MKTLALAILLLTGFALPQPGHRFRFPADYGAHPEFRIEWWYVTGHLYGPAHERYGFQATFFRLAGEHLPQPLYLAHAAVTDVANARFWHAEKLNRGGWDAHAAVGHLDVANGPWSLRMAADGSMRLSASVQADAAFTLELQPRKPLVVFGENGVSHKGAEPSAASYYLTFSRLAAQGTLRMGETTQAVAGEAWMDHEISSSQLGADQVGWDWTCIQLKGSPRELMLYRLRRKDGSADPASRLQWVTPAGKAVTEPFQWKVLETWQSPLSHARYPSRIRLETQDPDTRAPIAFLLEPLLPDQELSNALGGGPYWEGACKVLNADTGEEVGSAYLELTGYAKALKI